MKKLLLSLLLVSFNGAVYSQWTTQATGFATATRGIKEIRIVDANTVWATAYNGVTPTANVQEFTRTIDGGTTWTAGVINVGNTALKITGISPANGSTAWVGAFDDVNGLGSIWKTSDSGATWVRQNAAAYATAGKSWLNVVHFFDANNGVSVGDPLTNDFEIYRTVDGGTTWTAVPGLSIPNGTGEYGYTGVAFAAGNSFWFGTDGGNLYRTTDFGVSWTKHTGPLSDFGSAAVNGDMYFSDNNNGIILGTTDTGATYKIYTTVNGGANWSAGTAYTQPYKNLSYVPGTTTLVGTGFSGTGTVPDPYVYKSGYSNDNGVTWTNIDTGVQRTSGISFASGTTGWAGGFNTSPTVGGIYKYTGTALSLNGFDKKQMTATPNPTNGIVQLTGATINEVTVFDIVGKQVFNSKFSAMNDLSLDLSSLQTGAYVLKATDDSGATQTIKIMKN